MFLKAERLGGFILNSKKIKLIDRIVVLFKKRFIKGSVTFLGKQIYYTDSSAFIAIYNEVFNKKIYNYISKSDSPLIYDCGANIGLSVLYFKLLYPNSIIHAYEPDPNIFDLLKFNVSQYDFNDLYLHNEAIWTNNDMVSFLPQGGSSGKLTSFQTDTSVKAIRLKDLLKNKKIDFLKIDIEGAEYDVLKDCDTLLINVENLFIEYHSFWGEEQRLDEILLIVKNAGFTYYIQHETTSNSPFIRINSIGNMNVQINLFCYR